MDMQDGSEKHYDHWSGNALFLTIGSTISIELDLKLQLCKLQSSATSKSHQKTAVA